MTVHKRTFLARNYAKGGKKRAYLNKDDLTSEYWPGYRWVARRPFLMANGQPHPSGTFICKSFRTKRAAMEYAEHWSTVVQRRAA